MMFQTDFRYGGVAWGGDDLSLLYELVQDAYVACVGHVSGR